MSIALNARAYEQAALRIDGLYEDAKALHDSVSHKLNSIEHSGRRRTPRYQEKYNKAVIQRACDLNRLQKRFMPDIRAAADEITKLCERGWEEDPQILALLHKVALTVANFSEHPHFKQVATLILNPKGKLVAAATNRVPEGIPKSAYQYKPRIRKDFLLCSEPQAIAEALGVEIDLSEFKDLKGYELRLAVERAITKFRADLLEAAWSSDTLKGHHLLVTVSPCAEFCAPVVRAASPQSLMTVEDSGEHFTKAPGMLQARERLSRHMNIIFLPAPH